MASICRASEKVTPSVYRVFVIKTTVTCAEVVQRASLATDLVRNKQTNSRAYRESKISTVRTTVVAGLAVIVNC